VSAGTSSGPLPSGPAWPVRLGTHVLNPNGTAGRVLLLHGLGSDGTSWWRVASELADLGHLVVAPDLRSHGGSPTAVDHRIATLAEDVAILGDGWDLVVGHSLGGAVAADLLGRPSFRVARGLLLDPVLFLRDADREPLRDDQRADVGPELTAEVLAARYPAWHPRDLDGKRRAAAMVGPSTVDAVIDHNDPWDLRPAIGRWRVPVHVLCADHVRGDGGRDDGGRDDEDDPPPGPWLGQEVREALAQQADTSWERVVGAGHSIHRDHPAAVSAAVRRALERRP
jgi:pimeloyl-ACP methyl ester carboxylesterase